MELKTHFQYIKYVIRHKWFVFWACRALGVGVWQALIHDWSKFRLREWMPYVDYFYRRGGKDKHSAAGGAYSPGCDDAFDTAWLFHQHANPHHHQHWVLRQDDGEVKVMPMPEKYLREMIADWIGAGRAQGHGDDVEGWYGRNKEKMILHPTTRERIETLLEQRAYKGGVWR